MIIIVHENLILIIAQKVHILIPDEPDVLRYGVKREVNLHCGLGITMLLLGMVGFEMLSNHIFDKFGIAIHEGFVYIIIALFGLLMLLFNDVFGFESKFLTDCEDHLFIVSGEYFRKLAKAFFHYNVALGVFNEQVHFEEQFLARRIDLLCALFIVLLFIARVIPPVMVPDVIFLTTFLVRIRVLGALEVEHVLLAQFGVSFLLLSQRLLRVEIHFKKVPIILFIFLKN